MNVRTFVAFSLTFLLSMYFRTFFAVIGPELSRELSLSPFEFGVLSSAFFISFAAMQVPVGVLFDRFGCRMPMTALVICGAAGCAMIATASSFGQAVIGQGLLGVGCAPALMGMYFYYGRALPWQKAARVATMIAAIGSLGALVSATPLEFFVSAIGWRYAVALSACCMAVAGGLLYLAINTGEQSKEPSQDEASHSSTNVGFLILLSPIFLSASLGTVFRSAWASPYLVNVVEVSSQEAANVFAAVSVAGTLTGFALPLAMTRLSPGSIIGILYCVTIALTVGLALDPKQNVLFAGAVLSALYAIGNCHTIAMAEAQPAISGQRRGMILGLLNGLGFVGVAAFSPLFGLIARAFEPNLAFAVMFAATAAFLAASFFVYLFRGRMV
jgi:MFS family permease